MSRNDKKQDSAKDLAMGSVNSQDIAESKAKEPNPKGGLPKRFQEIAAKASDFSHVAIRRIFNHPEIREYGLNPYVVNKRGFRGWTPTTKADINDLVAQGALSKEEANTFEYDNHGYVRVGEDTIMGWMPEENARQREKQMAEKSRIKTEGLKQAARDRVRDAARGVPGVDIDFDAEEQVEETLHFGSH